MAIVQRKEGGSLVGVTLEERIRKAAEVRWARIPVVVCVPVIETNNCTFRSDG